MLHTGCWPRGVLRRCGCVNQMPPRTPQGRHKGAARGRRRSGAERAPLGRSAFQLGGSTGLAQVLHGALQSCAAAEMDHRVGRWKVATDGEAGSTHDVADAAETLRLDGTLGHADRSPLRHASRVCRSSALVGHVRARCSGDVALGRACRSGVSCAPLGRSARMRTSGVAARAGPRPLGRRSGAARARRSDSALGRAAPARRSGVPRVRAAPCAPRLARWLLPSMGSFRSGLGPRRSPGFACARPFGLVRGPLLQTGRLCAGSQRPSAPTLITKASMAKG